MWEIKGCIGRNIDLRRKISKNNEFAASNKRATFECYTQVLASNQCTSYISLLTLTHAQKSGNHNGTYRVVCSSDFGCGG